MPFQAFAFDIAPLTAHRSEAAHATCMFHTVVPLATELGHIPHLNPVVDDADDCVDPVNVASVHDIIVAAGLKLLEELALAVPVGVQVHIKIEKSCVGVAG